MTLKAVHMHIEAFNKNREDSWQMSEYQAWLNGYYVMCGVANIFSKKAKYPKNPMEVEKVVVEDMELSEEEKDKYRNDLFDNLMSMAEKHKSSLQST